MFTIVSPKAAGASNPCSHRPTVSSPLTMSSPPPRPSSPLSSRHPPYGASTSTSASRPPFTQSSPIRGPPCAPQQPSAPAQSRFASRPVKKVPLARSREDTLEGRRQQFFLGSRQRVAEKAWQRRDIEGFSLKQSFVDDNIRYRTAASKIITTDEDIQDAETYATMPAPEPAPAPAPTSWDEMVDEMADDAATYDDRELEARLADMMGDATGADCMDEDDDFDQALLAFGDGAPPPPHQHSDGDDGGGGSGGRSGEGESMDMS